MQREEYHKQFIIQKYAKIFTKSIVQKHIHDNKFQQ